MAHCVRWERGKDLAEGVVHLLRCALKKLATATNKECIPYKKGGGRRREEEGEGQEKRE